MKVIFEITDKTGRKIRLTSKQWKHIKQDHPEVKDEERIKSVLKQPDKITQPYYGSKHYYHKYFKHRKSPDKYLMIVVNYLNGEGFVVTAYYVSYIK